MKRLLRLIMFFLFAILLLGGVTMAEKSSEYYPLSQVRAGQRAVAKSVFRGTRIESFQVEILGVLYKYDGTRNLILGRILDGPVVKRKSGVIAGMSGSPVYINGKLAGAIALTWAFSKEPIAGITPIAEMLETWSKPALPSENKPQAAGSLTTSVQIGKSKIRQIRFSNRAQGSSDPPGVMTLVPLGGFVQCSGFNGRAARQLSDLLSPLGLQVVQGPAGGMEKVIPPFAPGAALGAQLVGGDLDVSALGTVTLVQGKRVLGFGHSLLQRGEIDLPMTGGYVYDIMPSVQISNKIMAPTKTIGRLLWDNQAAIGGELGGKSDMLPVSIEVADKDQSRSRKYHIVVARIRELMPGLVASSVLTAIDETRNKVGRGTTKVQIQIEAEGYPIIKRDNFGYSDSDAAMTAVPTVLAPLVTFTENEFGKLRLKRIRVKVATTDVRKTASIERVTVAQSRVKAGDKVTLAIALRPYGSPLTETTVQFNLPSDLPRGRVRIAVSAGSAAEESRASIGAPRPAPISMQQLIDRYLKADQDTELVVQAALTRMSASLRGEDLSDFPRTAAEALQASHPTDFRTQPSLLKVVIPTEWELTGRQMVEIQVENPFAVGPLAPPEPPSEAPAEEEAKEEPSERMEAFFNEDEIAQPAALPLAANPPQPGRKAPDKPGAEASSKKAEEAKPLTRPTSSWVQRAKGDYTKARLEGVVVADDGQLSLAPSYKDIATIPAEVVWSLAIRDGNIYVGTGNNGIIYRISPTGELSKFFSTGEMNVHALAFDGQGNLYAATSPHGKFFRIDPDGSGRVIFDSGSTYLWCLTFAPDGTMYAGAGSPARIYAIQPDGKAKVLVELPDTNVLSLLRNKDGDLFAGTSNTGVIYRIRPNGSATTVCKVTGASIDALVMDESGDIFASSSPGGEIYRIPTNDIPILFSKTEQKTIHDLIMLPSGDLIAAAGPSGVVMRIGKEGKPQTLCKPEVGVATALAMDEANFYIGNSGPSLVRKYGPDYAHSATMESMVLDAERTARWGLIILEAKTPTGTAVMVETRAGDSPDPTDYWNAWSPVSSTGNITSSPGRYLQYKLTLNTSDAKLTPLIKQIKISYRPKNRPPTCMINSPRSGERLAKKNTIKWQGQDPDKDQLMYEIAISSDLGDTWKVLKKDLAEVKYEWDTTQTPDGRYLLRLTARDGRAVPWDPESDDRSVVVWVDNTPPAATILRSSLSISDDKRAQAKGIVSDATSSLSSVEYRVDADGWNTVALPMIESSLQDFSITTEALDVGKHKLEVRAFDAAGNVGNDSVELTVK